MTADAAAGDVEVRPRAVSAATGAAAPAGSDRILIIGAGIAGLSCGCYLQMNGLQTEILEAGLLPGGLCTAWHRGPYVFDGCLRWLLGTNPSSAFHQIWTELGAIAGRKIISHDEVLRIEGPNGEVLSVPADLDELAREFKRVAPEDGDHIDRLISDARRCAPLEPPLEKPLELMSPLEKMKTGLQYLPMLPAILKWKGLPITSYVARYRNAFLREALLVIAGDKRMSTLVLVMVLGLKSRKNTAFVSGGSWAFTQAIASRYARLGGILRYKARVVSVTVENKRAVGIQCADGTSLRASTVVSCADGHTTIFKMLDGRFVDKKILSLYRSCDLFPAILQVSLGVDTTLPNAPRTLNLPVSGALDVDGATRHDRLEIEVFGSESALCPEGKSVITVRLPTVYEFWVRLKKEDPQRYRTRKRTIVRDIVAILEHRFPGLAGHIELADIATPATFVRYTGNWQGSYEGWLPTPRILGRRIACTLPGLKDFYMAGHWVVAGGGLPSAALSGRYVAQMICARHGRTFAASAP